jgi:hypothetical protein
VVLNYFSTGHYLRIKKALLLFTVKKKSVKFSKWTNAEVGTVVENLAVKLFQLNNLFISQLFSQFNLALLALFTVQTIKHPIRKGDKKAKDCKLQPRSGLTFYPPPFMIL